MSILLLVLKIIGWILLGLILLILLLLGIVCFVPARYSGKAVACEALKESTFMFKATWLFCLAGFYFEMKEGNQYYYARILWKKINLADKEKKPKSSEQPKTDKKKSKAKKKRDARAPLKERILNIKKVFTDQNNQKAFFLLLNELKYLCKHWGPRNLKADLKYALDNPANTGITLGIISMIPGIYKKGVKVMPDFEAEQMYLSGYAAFKGRIRGIHLIKVVVKMLLQEEIRNVMDQFKSK